MYQDSPIMPMVLHLKLEIDKAELFMIFSFNIQNQLD